MTNDEKRNSADNTLTLHSHANQATGENTLKNSYHHPNQSKWIYFRRQWVRCKTIAKRRSDLGTSV